MIFQTFTVSINKIGRVFYAPAKYQSSFRYSKGCERVGGHGFSKQATIVL